MSPPRWIQTLYAWPIRQPPSSTHGIFLALAPPFANSTGLSFAFLHNFDSSHQETPPGQCFDALALHLRIRVPCYCRGLRSPLHISGTGRAHHPLELMLRCFWIRNLRLSRPAHCSQPHLSGVIDHSQEAVHSAYGLVARTAPSAPILLATEPQPTEAQPPATSHHLKLYFRSQSCQALRDVVPNGERTNP